MSTLDSETEKERHERFMYGTKKDYPCANCNRVFVTRTALKRHQKVELLRDRFNQRAAAREKSVNEVTGG